MINLSFPSQRERLSSLSRCNFCCDLRLTWQLSKRHVSSVFVKSPRERLKRCLWCACVFVFTSHATQVPQTSHWRRNAGEPVAPTGYKLLKCKLMWFIVTQSPHLREFPKRWNNCAYLKCVPVWFVATDYTSTAPLLLWCRFEVLLFKNNIFISWCLFM